MKDKLRVKTRRFIARNLGFLVEWIYALRFYFLTFKKPPIIILTPGKVGSSSVYQTLKANLKNNIFHIHRISKKGIRDSESYHLESERNSLPPSFNSS